MSTPTDAPTVESLIAASQRAMRMLAHHVERLQDSADHAVQEFAEGRRKTARADASALVGELVEVDRLVDAALRLARASLTALDEELTRRGEPVNGRIGEAREPMVERRRFERRRGFDRRRSGLGPLPPSEPPADGAPPPAA